MGKVKISRRESYRITHTSRKHPSMGLRVRIVLQQDTEEFTTNKDGFLENLRAYVLTGPQGGSTINLPPCKLKPISARACRCKAYPFPHAPGLGHCNTSVFEEIVETEPTLEGLEVNLKSLFKGVQ